MGVVVVLGQQQKVSSVGGSMGLFVNQSINTNVDTKAYVKTALVN